MNQIINPTAGSIPYSFRPLSQNPATVAEFFWQASQPTLMNIQIAGLGNFGYTAPAIAVIEHFDPLANAIVRDIFVIPGGQRNFNVPVLVGSLDGELGAGAAKVAIFNAGTHTLFGGSLPGVPGWADGVLPRQISTFLDSVGLDGTSRDLIGLGDRLTQSNNTNGSFRVTDMGGATRFSRRGQSIVFGSQSSDRLATRRSPFGLPK